MSFLALRNVFFEVVGGVLHAHEVEEGVESRGKVMRIEDVGQDKQGLGASVARARFTKLLKVDQEVGALDHSGQGREEELVGRNFVASAYGLDVVVGRIGWGGGLR